MVKFTTHLFQRKRSFSLVIILFALSFVILCTFGYYVVNRLKERTHFNYLVSHTRDVIGAFNKIEAQLLQCETDQRGYLLTADTSFYNDYLRASASVLQAIDSVQALVADNTKQQPLIKRLDSLTILRLAYLNRNSSGLRYTDSVMWGRLMLKGKELMDDLRLTLTQLRAAELQLLARRTGAGALAEASLGDALILGFIFVVIVNIGSFLTMIWMLRRLIQSEHRLEKQNLVLQAGIEDLQQVTKVFSHDLQEPLRKMRTFLSQFQMKAEGLSTQGQYILGRVGANAERASKLVHTLMVYTTLSTHRPALRMMDAEALVSECLQGLQPKIESTGAAITIDVEAQLWADEAQAKLALEALLSNALTYTAAGKTPQIYVSSYYADAALHPSQKDARNAKYVVIQVADNGIGIDEKYAHKIFSVFQRLHQDEEVYKGSGIGLAIAKRVMNNHHGKISFSQKDGKTLFRLAFPVLQR